MFRKKNCLLQLKHGRILNQRLPNYENLKDACMLLEPHLLPKHLLATFFSSFLNKCDMREILLREIVGFKFLFELVQISRSQWELCYNGIGFGAEASSY